MNFMEGQKYKLKIFKKKININLIYYNKFSL